MGAHGYKRLIDGDTQWMNQAVCARTSVDMFAGDRHGIDHAKAVCDQCPARQSCLDYALANRIEHGVWGGCSERERRAMSRERRLAG